MGETEVKKVESTYLVTNGKYQIKARVNHNNSRITLTPSNNNADFMFSNSTSETLWMIGSLIRDAADLISLD